MLLHGENVLMKNKQPSRYDKDKVNEEITFQDNQGRIEYSTFNKANASLKNKYTMGVHYLHSLKTRNNKNSHVPTLFLQHVKEIYCHIRLEGHTLLLK